LNQLGIEIVEEATRKENSPAAPIPKKKTSTKKAATGSADDSSYIDDPIRLYLKEIGKVSLLSGDQEVDLAKRIEEGEILIEKAVLGSALLINELIKNHSKVKSGKIKLTDVLRVNRLYYFSSVDMSELEKRYAEKMKIVVEEDNKIFKNNGKIRRLGENAKEIDELKAKNAESWNRIIQAVEEMGINENEITSFPPRFSPW
jgi:RNA polymerase primary sigma factor